MSSFLLENNKLSGQLSFYLGSLPKLQALYVALIPKCLSFQISEHTSTLPN